MCVLYPLIKIEIDLGRYFDRLGRDYKLRDFLFAVRMSGRPPFSLSVIIYPDTHWAEGVQRSP